MCSELLHESLLLLLVLVLEHVLLELLGGISWLRVRWVEEGHLRCAWSGVGKSWVGLSVHEASWMLLHQHLLLLLRHRTQPVQPTRSIGVLHRVHALSRVLAQHGRLLTVVVGA